MVFIFLDEANIPVLRKWKYFIGPCYTVIVFCSYSIVSVWKFFPGLHHNLGWDSSRLWLCLKQLAQVSIRGWYKRGTAFSSRIESNLILLNEEENYLLFFLGLVFASRGKKDFCFHRRIGNRKPFYHGKLDNFFLLFCFMRKMCFIKQ